MYHTNLLHSSLIMAMATPEAPEAPGLDSVKPQAQSKTQNGQCIQHGSAE